MLTFEQQWIENDYNPFVLFSSDGKVLSTNVEAQFLLGVVNTKELFELATAYASVSFGFKTTFIDLEFGRYKFFALMVGYEDEDSIGIKLYQTQQFKLSKPKPTGELVNIYTLIDLCISANSISSKTTYLKEFDPTIPEIILSINNFIKILNKIYLCFKESKEVTTRVFYRVGEHIVFENKEENSKKYSIFSIEVKGDSMDDKNLNELKTAMTNSDFYIDIKDKIAINIPMITK